MADDATKKSSKLKWVLLIFILLLVVGGGIAAWFLLLTDKVSFSGGSGASRVERVEAQPVSPIGITVPLAQFTTNLADPLGQRFIRLNLEVEVADKRVGNEIVQQNARLRDSILMLLGSKSYADIATTESRMMLRSEITDRLNAILGPGKIYQVFITDLVVQ
jgi:flagellar FliL protein